MATTTGDGTHALPYKTTWVSGGETKEYRSSTDAGGHSDIHRTAWEALEEECPED